MPPSQSGPQVAGGRGVALDPGCREVVRSPIFGYSLRVKRPTPLDTLRELRERTQQEEQSRLAVRLEAERSAEQAEQQAQRLLQERTRSAEALRAVERRRLQGNGISAADGLRRVAWESAERRAVEQLSSDVARATAKRREATRDQERARLALERAHAELEEVQRRLKQREREARYKDEQAQQETQDEASARRFTDRSGA